MISVIHTLDYEIHGNGEGCPRRLMVEPTANQLNLFDEYGAKLTIMADVAEILKFGEYRDQFGRDDYYYEAIVEQLRDAIRRGHDVQLHLHCSYFNARFENGKWEQDWSEYNFAGLPEKRIDEVVARGKDFLETLLRPVDPSYHCTAFRAANWAVSPSGAVVRALIRNGIKTDTSVFKYGRRDGIVSFDYSNAYSNILPWRACEEDICRRDDSSELLEIPIYCERRWIGAFLTRPRIARAISGFRHPVRKLPVTSGNGSKPRNSRLKSLIKRHAWKADFNQCTGRQLIGSLHRAIESTPSSKTRDIPFVLIGHSKLFTDSNARSLRPFLEEIAAHPDRLTFATLSSFYDQSIQTNVLRPAPLSA